MKLFPPVVTCIPDKIGIRRTVLQQPKWLSQEVRCQLLRSASRVINLVTMHPGVPRPCFIFSHTLPNVILSHPPIDVNCPSSPSFPTLSPNLILRHKGTLSGIIVFAARTRATAEMHTLSLALSLFVALGCYLYRTSKRCLWVTAEGLRHS